MGAAIGEMLPLAIGIAISPLAIVAVILILTTPRARTNGPSFLGGWLLGLAVVGGVALVVTDAAESAGVGGPRSIVSVVTLALGAALLVLAWRRFRSRPRRGEDPPLPKWMAALDDFTPGRSLAVAALLGGIKPKNLILTAAAAAGIAESGLGGARPGGLEGVAADEQLHRDDRVVRRVRHGADRHGAGRALIDPAQAGTMPSCDAGVGRRSAGNTHG